MANPSVSIPDELKERIDERRGNVPRSAWIREAIRVRLEAEREGYWDELVRSGREADVTAGD